MTQDRLLAHLRDALVASDLEVSELVESARSEAHARVHAAMVDVLTEQLLERAVTLLASAPSTPETTSSPEPVSADDPPTPASPVSSAPTPAGAATSTPTATYLFGIVPPGGAAPADAPMLPGGGEVRALAAIHCAAIVCDMDPRVLDGLEEAGTEGLEILAAAAHAHDEILAGLAERGPVLPLRLGTILPDDGAVLGLLDDRADVLVAELERLRGHTEWAVTVRSLDRQYEPDAQRPATTGRDYLAQRQQALHERDRRWDREHGLADAIHAPLAACAVEAERVDSRPFEQAVPPLLHGVYLVRDDEFDRFEHALAQLRDEHPDTVIELSGPWPAYHFTRTQLGGNVEGPPE